MALYHLFDSDLRDTVSSNLSHWDSVSSGVSAPEVSSQYQSLIDANPYRNAEYNQSFWQRLLHSLGFRTQADAWKENMAVQASEYDASILQKAYNENYDDAQSQVSRMKAAGLNPDLDPSSVSPGESSSMPEDPSTPMQSTGQEGTLMSFAEGVMNIASTAVGLMSGVQGISRNRIENRILSLQEDSQIAELSRVMAPYFLPQSDAGSQEGYSWYNFAIDAAELWSGQSLNPKQRDKFLSNIHTYYSGAMGEGVTFDVFKKNLESRFGLKTAQSSLEDEYGTLNLILAEELGSLNKEVMEWSAKAAKQSAKAEVSEGEYTDSYYSGLEGATAASAENAQNQFNLTNMEMNEMLNASIGRMIEKLDNARKEGGISGSLAGIAMSLLAGLRLMLTTQGLPSVHTSSSAGGSNWSNGSGTAGHTSASFGIGW